MMNKFYYSSIDSILKDMFGLKKKICLNRQECNAFLLQVGREKPFIKGF